MENTSIVDIGINQKKIHLKLNSMTFIQWLIEKGYISSEDATTKIDISKLHNLINPSVNTLYEMYLDEGYGDD